METDEELLRAFHACNELDLALEESFEEAASSRPKEAAPVSERRGRLIAFPSWPRTVQAVAVAAALAVVVGLAVLNAPRGPLRWGRTRIALLDQSRGTSEEVTSSLDAQAVNQTCALLQETVGDLYAAEAGDREPVRWDVRILVSEHAEGALAVRVEGRPRDDQAFEQLARRRYPDLSSFGSDLSNLAGAIVETMQSRRPQP